METLDYEKLVISTALRWPDHPDHIIQGMVLSLEHKSFDDRQGIAHQLIWHAIQDLVTNNTIVSIPTICNYLGDNLAAAGGEIYLRSLYDFAAQMKVQEPTEWNVWCKVVYTGGVLRDLGIVVSRYAEMLKDFEKLVRQTDDPEIVVHRMLDEVQSIVTTNFETGYKEIGNAVDAELEKLAQIETGKIDVIAVGQPSLEAFGIPAPRSFVVVIGMPSMGKTAWAFNCLGLGKALHLFNTNEPGVVAINSLETPDNIITRRMVCAMQSIDSTRVRLNQLTDREKERYREGLQFLRQLPIVYDDSPDITTEQLAMRATALNLTRKRIMGISDYAELFCDQAGRDGEAGRVASIVRNIRHIAWSTGSCEVLLSQVNNTVLGKANKIAGIDSARYTAVAAHASDGAIEIWNPIQMNARNIDFTVPDGYSEDYAYAIIQKNKNGPLGHVAYHWEAPYTRFIDTAVTGLNAHFDFSAHLGGSVTQFTPEEVNQEFDY